MPKGTAAPKYGTRECLQCGKIIHLQIQRDISRKRFCSRRCSSKYRWHWVGKLMETNITEESRQKQAASLRKTYKEYGHPLLGRPLSQKTKQKLAESQRRRARERPNSFARGKRHHMWRGGIYKYHSYVFILQPEHPRASSAGYVLEHIVIAEQMIGRRILRGEVVHHKNGVRDDNRPDNLRIFGSQSEHASFHNRERQSVKENTNVPCRLESP